MSTETFQWVVAIGVMLAALSMITQAIIVGVMYKLTKDVTDKVTPLIPRAHAILDSAQTTLAQSKKHVVDITRKTSEFMDTANQLAVVSKTHVDSIMGKVEEIADISKGNVNELMAKVQEVADLSKQQLVKLDGVVTDATERAKVQMDRAELVIDDTVGRVHETVSTVHHGIMKPVKEVSGVAQGVRAAFTYLLRGNRPAIHEATQDEEMFI